MKTRTSGLTAADQTQPEIFLDDNFKDSWGKLITTKTVTKELRFSSYPHEPLEDAQ